MMINWMECEVCSTSLLWWQDVFRHARSEIFLLCKDLLVASEGHELVYVSTLNAQNRQGKV